MTYPAQIEEQAEKLGVSPEDLLDFYRGLKPLNPESLVCPECGKEYKTESGLRSHVNTVHSDPEVEVEGQEGESG